MKQILTAGVLAIGIHGLLLGMNFKWPGRISLTRPKTHALNMTLTPLPVKTTPKPSLQKPEPALKKTPIIEKKKKKPPKKSIAKTPPKNEVRIPVQEKKQQVPKTFPEKTVEKIESRVESEQNASKELSKAAKQTDAVQSTSNVIRKARPVYRSNPSPNYPRVARIRGYQGNVLLDVLVSRDGKVHDLKIHQSSGYPLLDRAAASSVIHWLFEPGMIGEKKVDMWVRVPIRFELK